MNKTLRYGLTLCALAYLGHLYLNRRGGSDVVRSARLSPEQIAQERRAYEDKRVTYAREVERKAAEEAARARVEQDTSAAPSANQLQMWRDMASQYVATPAADEPASPPADAVGRTAGSALAPPGGQPAASAEPPRGYVARRGETLESIVRAQLRGEDALELVRRLNPKLSTGVKLAPGTVVRLPREKVK